MGAVGVEGRVFCEEGVGQGNEFGDADRGETDLCPLGEVRLFFSIGRLRSIHFYRRRRGMLFLISKGAGSNDLQEHHDRPNLPTYHFQFRDYTSEEGS